MPKIEIEQKRPLDATPERAAILVDELGVKQIELAKQWHISPGRVSHLVAKGRQSRKPKPDSRE